MLLPAVNCQSCCLSLSRSFVVEHALLSHLESTHKRSNSVYIDHNRHFDRCILTSNARTYGKLHGMTYSLTMS